MTDIDPTIRQAIDDAQSDSHSHTHGSLSDAINGAVQGSPTFIIPQESAITELRDKTDAEELRRLFGLGTHNKTDLSPAGGAFAHLDDTATPQERAHAFWGFD
ncbi:MAG: hypothetical protein QM286_13695 [Acidobacteriota bacterium]|nr:hypothetical protein [Acidobacteriota bacterium]